MTDTPAPILSHNFDLSRVADVRRRDPAHEIGITATEAQCAAIAAGFGLPGIAALTGHFALRRAPDGLVHATLTLRARVTQTCVVTSETFEQAVAEQAALILLTEAQAEARRDAGAEGLIDPDAPDDIVATGTLVDLGAILTEQLALALDPYPRKPDAAIPADLTPQRESRFSALAQLRDLANAAGKPGPDRSRPE
ncbi:DUF177 domain-containing protein [Acidiphilium sp. PA]|uniref:DUF177 domain-containing protein n=1 Tax=Acidiphilium sp. PA TaxID=2871705 RepID=UPI002244D907|nr:DUF177 domain-containing protein [Acidiphilium sp. PA]MCW8308379.1 DUF177 domain-containing protein [Acidiphilium sp. PA]